MKIHFLTINRLFRRNLWLVIPFCAVWLLSLGYDLLRVKSFIEYAYLDSMYMNMVTMTMYFSLAGYALFMYIGYEMAIRPKEMNLEEIMRALPTERVNFLISLPLFLLCLAGIFAIPAVAVNVLLYCLNPRGVGAMLANQLGACMLYYGITPLLGGLMGMGMAKLFGSNRIMVYSVAVLLVLMTTSFVDPLFSALYRVSGMRLAGNIAYEIKNLLTFTPYGMVRQYDTDFFYGISQEVARWLLAGMWVGLWGLVLLWRQPGKAMPGRQRACLFAAGILLIACAAGYGCKGSVLYLDERPEGIIAQDQDFYMEQYLQGKQIKEVDPGGFGIETYTFQIKLGQKMRASVTMQLTELDEERGQYIFTLYRGMHIKSIRNDRGDRIPFERHIDQFTISQEDIPDNRVLTIDYEGSHPRFYSNDQAAALPGYFPYYPMEGIRPVYKTEQYGYEISGSPRLHQFSVSVDAPYPVYTNLNAEGEVWAGNAHDLTLWGSRMLTSEKRSGGIETIMPVGLDTEAIQNTLEDAQERIDRVRQWAGESIPAMDFKQLKVFWEPTYFSVSSVTEDVVFLQDHLLVSNYVSHSPDAIAEEYVIRQLAPSKRETQLANRFAWKIVGEGANQSRYVDADRLLQKLTEPHSKEGEDYFAWQQSLEEALHYLGDQPNQDYMLRILQFLCTDEANVDEGTFLAGLLKEAMEG